MNATNKPGERYHIMAIELDDVVPRRDPHKPNLYVTVTISKPDERFEVLRSSKRQAWYSGHLLKLRNDLVPSTSFTNKVDADAELKAKIKEHKADGFTVNRDTKVWRVYVVELDAAAVSDPGEGFVYVGETSKDPEERLQIHLSRGQNKKGPLYSRHVARRGVRLLPELAPDEIYFSAQAAKKAEAAHAEYLRVLGYKVRGGH
jgi:hypothetical protein